MPDLTSCSPGQREGLAPLGLLQSPGTHTNVVLQAARGWLPVV